MRLDRGRLFPVEGDEARSATNERGVSNLLKHLQDTFCQKLVSKKGELLTDFVAGTKHHRRRSERISDGLVWFDEAVFLMAEHGVEIGSWGDLAGWILHMRAG